jgi:hypothetical protein
MGLIPFIAYEASEDLPLLEIALVLVRLDHIASVIEINDRIILPLAAP